MRFGLNDDPQNWERGITEAAGLGAKTARVAALWYEDPENKRELATKLRQLGLRPLFPLGGTTLPPTEVYTEMARRWAKAYPSAIFELWNEPNLPAFGSLLPSQVVTISLAAYNAIIEESSSAKVIGPAIAPVATNWPDYQRRVYSALPRAMGVSVHCYPRSKTPIDVVQANFESAAEYGDVHFTEIGFMRSVYGKKQAGLSAQAISLLDDLGAKDCVFHRLLSSPDPNQWEQDAAMGVLDHPALKKAIGDAVAKL